MTTIFLLAVFVGSLPILLLVGLLAPVLRKFPVVGDTVYRTLFVVLFLLPMFVLATPRLLSVHKIETKPIRVEPSVVRAMNQDAKQVVPSSVKQPSGVVKSDPIPTVSGMKTSVHAKRYSERIDFTRLLLIGWGTGAMTCLLVMAWSLRKQYRIVRDALPATDSDWLAACTDIQNRLKIAEPIQYRFSREVDVPQVVGIFRPVMLFPIEQKKRLPDSGVLVHELTHIKRRDVLWQAYSGIVSSLYWFQPLVWIHAAGMRRIREMICDENVLREGIEPSRYAETLLDMASRVQRKYSLTAAIGCSVASPQGKTFLEHRILTILNPETNRETISPFSKTVIVLTFVLVTVLSVVLSPAWRNENRRVKWFQFIDQETKKTDSIKNDFGYYFPHEQLLLQDFNDMHEQCRDKRFSGMSAENLNTATTNASNVERLKITYAQMTQKLFDDASKTLDSIGPKLMPGESTDSNMAQRHDVRKGDEKLSEYYLKDRLLRYLMRSRLQNGDDVNAFSDAMKIFSVPERNDALLELLRFQCGEAVAKKDGTFEKALLTQSKIVDRSRDHGFGILAVAYGKTGQRRKAIESVRKITDHNVRELAMAWSVSPEAKDQDVSYYRLLWDQARENGMTTTQKEQVQNSVRLMVQRQPASREKFVFLCEIANDYVRKDAGVSAEILKSIFDDVRESDDSQLVLGGTEMILDANRTYRTETEYVGLTDDEIANLGNLIVKHGKSRWSNIPDDDEPLKREPGRMLRSVLPYDSLSEVPEMIFSLTLRRDVLKWAYDDVCRSFRNPRSKGFSSEPFYQKAKPETKKYYLAAVLNVFFDSPDFPWREYLDEIDRIPGTDACLRERIKSGLRGKYDQFTTKEQFAQRYELLEKRLGIAVVER